MNRFPPTLLGLALLLPACLSEEDESFHDSVGQALDAVDGAAHDAGSRAGEDMVAADATPRIDTGQHDAIASDSAVGTDSDAGDGDADAGATDLADGGQTADGGDTSDDATTPLPSSAPARYPGGQVHSPIPWAVAERLRDIVSTNPKTAPRVFMKVGASSTVSSKTLHCFAGKNVDLGAYQGLQATLDYFLAGNAAGATPFNRKTKAAKSGKTAKWALSGSPAPLQVEMQALSPRAAIIHYGTNDMGMGATYMHASYPFYESMMKLIDEVVSAGAVPILTGISPRKDKVTADRWVATYNALIRGLAQRWQVPFIDLHYATAPLSGHGMASDGIHLNGYSGGACRLTTKGLKYGYNVRNLIVLQALARYREVVAKKTVAVDPDGPPLKGSGTAAAPFEIASLPFSDARHTAKDGVKLIDSYPGCASKADESGPEVYYRLDLTQPTAIRALVVDGAGVDIDVHLLDKSATGAGCLARDHRVIEGTIGPGTFHLALDTFTKDGKAAAGEYLLTVVRCDVGDGACAKKL